MNMSNLQRQRGVSMIEVLVAVLVLSLGILTAASLQTTSLQSNQRAMLRSQAVLVAQQVIDELRSQRNMPGGGYVDSDDLTRWRAMAANYLPAPESSAEAVDVTITSQTQVQVTVTWVDDRRGTTAAERETSFVMDSSI